MHLMQDRFGHSRGLLSMVLAIYLLCGCVCVIMCNCTQHVLGLQNYKAPYLVIENGGINFVVL